MISFVFFMASVLGAESKNEASLETVLKNALANNGQIRESMGEIELARSQLALANAALFPKAGALLLAAPIFEERGNALHSESNGSKWGPLLKGSLEIAQPLYTFGQISNYRKAAEHNVLAQTELADVKRAEVLATAKELYYGFQMANGLGELVEGLIKYLEEAVETAEKNLKNKKSSVKPHDIYKLKTALEDLRQKRLYAQQAKQTAERAVLWISSMPGDTSLSSESPTPESFEMKSLDDYLKLAKAHRPEFRALLAGQTAREALRDAKKAQNYPVIFLGALASYAWSPVRDKQDSVFAYDPFNRFEGGVGLGLKFDLEFTKHAAEASEQEAELIKLKAKESYAVPGIELQVKKAFWELQQAKDGLEIAKRRKDIAKRWFVSSSMGWSIGITLAKDLLESLEGDGLARKNFIETVYALNVALGKLSQAVGHEVTSLKYR